VRTLGSTNDMHDYVCLANQRKAHLCSQPRRLLSVGLFDQASKGENEEYSEFPSKFSHQLRQAVK